MFILATDQIKKWWWGIKNTPSFKLLLFKIVTSSDQLKKIGTKTAFIAIILIWYLIETIVIAPHFIAYFNEFVGGAKNGYKYAVDSNLDWGQDLKRLAKFVEENHIEKLKVDYFGGGSPAYYLGDKFEPWQSAKGRPEPNSWLAVSLTFLQNSQGKPVPGFERKPEDSYEWLKIKRPMLELVIQYSFITFN